LNSSEVFARSDICPERHFPVSEQISLQANVLRAKIFWADVTPDKCLAGECHSGQMSSGPMSSGKMSLNRFYELKLSNSDAKLIPKAKLDFLLAKKLKTSPFPSASFLRFYGRYLGRVEFSIMGVFRFFWRTCGFYELKLSNSQAQLAPKARLGLSSYQ
jgi:hypothetical protein